VGWDQLLFYCPPKPFVKLVHGKSFFEITYARFRKRYKPEEIFVSTEDNFVPYVKKQAPEIPQNNIISEPERKDILGAVGLATAVVNKYFPGEPVLVAWAKNIMTRESVFLDAIEVAGEFASEKGLIVSIDAEPTYPSVHQGWVKKGKSLGIVDGFKFLEIEKHVEKPDLNKAKKLFKSKKWLINTGHRIWKTDLMLGFYKEHQPAMYQGLVKIANAWGTKNQEKILKREYHKFKKESIEYGIFEKLSENVRATIAADMGWEDIGISWEEYYKALITPNDKMVVEGGAEAVFMDSENNLVHGPKGKMIMVIGVSNIAVIDTPDGLLVCKIDQSQKVKKLYKKLKQYHKEYIE